MIERLFLAHPRQVDESYAAHFRTSARIGFVMIAGGIACLVHAVVPALHQRTGSGTIRRLAAEIEGRAGGRPRDR